MKVMQINCVYKKGSTGKIVFDIHKYLENQNVESLICYGRGSKIREKNVYKTCSEISAKYTNFKSRIIGIPYSGSYFSTKKIINLIEKENPDVVHLQCINGFFVNIYSLIKYLKVKNIKTILTLHAEFMHTGNCSHAYLCDKWKTGCGKCPDLRKATKSYFFDFTRISWNKMKQAFDGFDNLIVVSVSDWLKNRALQSPILRDHKHITILNGIDNNQIFTPNYSNYLKNKLNLKEEKVLLHVTANFSDKEKGGDYILKLANILINENIKIIVIGNSDKTIKFPPNIINIGRVENQKELAKYYSIADLTILTSKRETFSMVCAESLSCGTPVVGFEAGAPEQISIKQYSEFVPYGNINLLLECIYKWIDKKKELGIIISDEAKIKYSSDNMCKQYLNLYKDSGKSYEDI